MIVNEPLGAAEYDESRPFGCLFHGLVRYDRINSEYYLTLPNGTRKKYPFPLDGRKASQIFDLHRPITSTPQEMLDEGMKAENYAIINHGAVCGQQIEGTIYHSETLGNWVVKIEGKAYIPENKADITLTFTPFGVLGEDARTVFTQQIHLDDIGQINLRQKVHASASARKINGTSYTEYIGDDDVFQGTYQRYIDIRPTYASRTGKRVSIGIPAVGMHIMSGIEFYTYQYPIIGATWLAWLMLDISDGMSTGLLGPHPTGKISLLYNRSDALGFSQTLSGGDYWFEIIEAQQPVAVWTTLEDNPQPDFVANSCSKGDTAGPFLDVHRTLTAPYYRSNIGSRPIYEYGFIDRVSAVYFDDDENPYPVLYTSYESSKPIFVVNDDSMTGDLKEHTYYSCSDCYDGICNWAGRRTYDFKGSGGISITYGDEKKTLLRIKYGSKVLKSFGKIVKITSTETATVLEYYDGPIVQPPVTQHIGIIGPPYAVITNSDSTEIVQQEVDGDIPRRYLAGPAAPFNPYFISPKCPFVITTEIAFSAMTTAYNMMYLIPSGSGHCLIFTNFIPTNYGQIPPTDAVAFIIDSKGKVVQLDIPQTQPLSSSYPWPLLYSLEQVFSAVANPMRTPTAAAIRSGYPDYVLIGYV